MDAPEMTNDTSNTHGHLITKLYKGFGCRLLWYILKDSCLLYAIDLF